MSEASFLKDVQVYVGRVREFSSVDWLVYIGWVGMMVSLFAAVFGFIYVGHSHGVVFPAYVWNVPLGISIFVVAIGFDTIGHRTVYREDLRKAEALVHHITMFCGITSVICLVLAYEFPAFFRFPALVLVLMAVFYSVVDESMHWKRYLNSRSDRVEMWSHLFIFVGHLLMSVSWFYWFEQGYPGVAQTLAILK